MTLVQIYDAWFSGELAEKQTLVTERLNAYEAQMSYDYVAGLEAFIHALRSQGVKTAVVTSSNQPKMEAVYRSHPEFKGLFDAILTAEDFDRSKPDPDCYLKAAGRFGIAPEHCVVFEDSFNGLKSGRAAGMYVVGSGHHEPHRVYSSPVRRSNSGLPQIITKPSNHKLQTSNFKKDYGRIFSK